MDYLSVLRNCSLRSNLQFARMLTTSVVISAIANSFHHDT